MKARKENRKTKEVAVTKHLDDDAVVAPEQVFAAAAGALQESTRGRGNSSAQATGRQSGSTAAAAPVSPARARSQSTTLGGSSGGGGSMSGSASADDSADAERRRAAVERAKSIGASIALAVEAEGVSASGATPKGGLVAFRAYGDKEMREAAGALERALLAAPSPSKKIPKAQAAQSAEAVASLRREEGMRAAQFMAFVNRASMGAREDDQMAAVREYAAVCTKLLDELMASLPTLPSAIAPAVSTYLSHLSQHKQLASKALASEDPRRAAAEAEARRRASLVRATSAAEARAAGIGTPSPQSRGKAGDTPSSKSTKSRW